LVPSIKIRNARGNALTRDGVAYVIKKYVERGAVDLSQLRRRRVSPHVFRHSCAVALLQAGVDVSVIRDYLGHSSVATTSRYITTNLETKRAALDAFWNRAGLQRTSNKSWRPSPALLRFLDSL
jgi:site-specific recombinase XerD